MGLNSQDLARLGPRAQKQVLEKLGAQQRQRESKYHNQKDSRGEIKFDSKKEARRYDELMVLLRAGKIRNLRLQAQFTLQESYITETGERVRAIRYVADFAYEKAVLLGEAGTNDPIRKEYWVPVVEDVKSSATKTEKYKIKAKLFRERYGFGITEV